MDDCDKFVRIIRIVQVVGVLGVGLNSDVRWACAGGGVASLLCLLAGFVFGWDYFGCMVGGRGGEEEKRRGS